MKHKIKQFGNSPLPVAWLLLTVFHYYSPAPAPCDRRQLKPVICAAGQRWVVLEVALKMEEKRRRNWNHGAGRTFTIGTSGEFLN